MKQRAKKAFKKHYILCVAICLIAAFIGSEFAPSLGALRMSRISTNQIEERLAGPSAVSRGAIDVIHDILEGDETAGREKANEIKAEEIQASEQGNPVLGHSKGVLADLVNNVTSGTILVNMLAAFHSLTGSENAAVFILILLGTALLFSAFFFLVYVFRVITRRMFLEGRIYEKVPLQRALFLLHERKWVKACCTMFLTFLYQLLWSLTIVGGLVKRYSYYLVPYIVAENPDISPKEAILLSRNMMNGHKWECFVFELSFIPWILLGILTCGISAILYSNPYREATFCEYYAVLRQQSKQKRLKGSELLNDTYLYVLPEEDVIQAAYGDVISALEHPNENIPRLTGVRRFFADYLGVLLTNSKAEKAYEQRQAHLAKMELLKDAVARNAYPARLSAIPEVTKRTHLESIHYLRDYSVWSIGLLFFIFSFLGWVWEVSLHLVMDGTFVNRGVLHGPWLPIYGGGGILILMLLNKLRSRPVLEFIGMISLCGGIEYTTSYLLETMHNGERWWDYTGYFLNLNGRICAEGLLVFGIAGIVVVYVLAPLLDNIIQKIRPSVLIPLCLLLFAVLMIDTVYSTAHPNTGKGITDYERTADCLQYPPSLPRNETGSDDIGKTEVHLPLESKHHLTDSAELACAEEQLQKTRA